MFPGIREEGTAFLKKLFCQILNFTGDVVEFKLQLCDDLFKEPFCSIRYFLWDICGDAIQNEMRKLRFLQKMLIFGVDKFIKMDYIKTYLIWWS